LPIQLLYFSANCNDKPEVNLRWSTASEQNADRFIIQKSRDLNTWVYVGETPAAGNSSSVLNYALTDENPFLGTSYYRMLQLDFDGAEEIYRPISTNCGEAESSSMVVYPNPTSGSFTVELNSLKLYASASITIVDLTGKIITSRKVTISEGVNNFYFAKQLEMGMYLIRVNEDDETQSMSIVVKN